MGMADIESEIGDDDVGNSSVVARVVVGRRIDGVRDSEGWGGYLSKKEQR
jgi:hypothetical protein